MPESIATQVSLFILILFLPLSDMFPITNLKKHFLSMKTSNHHSFDYSLQLSIFEKLFRYCEKFYTIGFVEKYWPKSHYEELKLKISLSGLSSKISAEVIIGAKLFLPLCLFSFTFLNFIFDFSVMKFITVILSTIIGFVFPEQRINSIIKERKLKIQQQVPNIINTMAVITEAGLGLFEAIDKICSIKKGYFVDELKKLNDEVSMGFLRKDALKSLADRCQLPEVNVFVSTISQTLDKGSSGVSKILKDLASDMWILRKNRSKELGGKASMKMFMPMLFLIFPAMMIFLLGPTIISNFLGITK